MAKQRITVPEDHFAIVLTESLARELFAALTILRRRKRMGGATYNHIAAIAGDVLLAALDTVPVAALLDAVEREDSNGQA